MEKGESDEFDEFDHSPILELILENLTIPIIFEHTSNDHLPFALSYFSSSTTRNETRTNSRSITKTIRPLSIIIKIESFPSFELSGISGITEWIRETRKQRIGRIGLRERGERDGSDFRAG